ncbi:MAPEG family protein [Shewanella sp. NR704-98]|uniref:MAPEG family protein n=1 Tax=Shewanella nanhaiensis TaxID=2864872 RepID=A0ABS7DZ64_9GAMM|nr:MAPEG family protein [Shewanella nanhaiensis]
MFPLIDKNIELIWPLFPVGMLIILIASLWLFTLILRLKSVIEGRVKYSDVMFVNLDAMPKRVALLSRSHDNQYQQPLLFILLMLFIMHFQLQGVAWFLSSALFVTARYWHAFEHVRGNHLLRRTCAFIIASCTLWGMWCALFVTQLF